jgi:hypothetical protein
MTRIACLQTCLCAGTLPWWSSDESTAWRWRPRWLCESALQDAIINRPRTNRTCYLEPGSRRRPTTVSSISRWSSFGKTRPFPPQHLFLEPCSRRPYSCVTSLVILLLISTSNATTPVCDPRSIYFCNCILHQSILPRYPNNHIGKP